MKTLNNKEELKNHQNISRNSQDIIEEVDEFDEVERNHACKILYLFLRKLMSWIFLIIIVIKNMHSDFGFSAIFFALFIILSFVMFFSMIDWYNQIFYFKDEAIYYKSGLMNIKIREIQFKKVNTVDLSQGILEKAFGLAKIKIDTASLSKDESELSLLLNKEKAIEIRNLILNRKDDETVLEEVSYDCYTLNSSQLMLYALTSNAIAKGIGIIFVAYTFLDDYFLDIFDIKLFDKGHFTIQYLLTKAIWIIGAILVISITLSVLQSFIRYYNFKVYVDKDKLNIRYGLLNEKHYSFARNKIKGIHSKQNLIMQLFHIKTLEIESIGYGDEKGESAILFPICNVDLERKIINDILPEFNFGGCMQVPPKRALIRFIWKKLVFIAILAGIFTYYFSFGFLSVLLFPFALILGYMQFKNTAVGMEKDLLVMSYNGFYKVGTVVKKSAVQSIGKSYTYFQKKRKLANCNVSIFSNQKYKSIQVENLEDQMIDDYLKKVR